MRETETGRVGGEGEKEKDRENEREKDREREREKFAQSRGTYSD